MKLDADWIVGFTDADGCFSVRTHKAKNTMRYTFLLSQDARSQHVLFAIKSFFGVGSVHKAGANMLEYVVGDMHSLTSVILPFFEKHRLRTTKYNAWLSFRNSVLAHSSNITKQAKVYDAFPENTCQMHIEPITALWLVGFIDGDGCFVVSIVKGYPRPQFLIGVDSQDQLVCESIQSFLGCGIVYKRQSGIVMLQISRRADLIHRLFPILYTNGNCHRLRTQKRHSASLFRRVVLAMEKGQHHKTDGMVQMRRWKERMRFVACSPALRLLSK